MYCQATNRKYIPVKPAEGVYDMSSDELELFLTLQLGAHAVTTRTLLQAGCGLITSSERCWLQ